MGDLLTCQQAQRAVLLSGTPFDNSSGDLDTYLSEGWLGGGQDIKAMYSFVVSVADAEGNAVSSSATQCAPRFDWRFPESRPDVYFRLEALFDNEAVLNVGAKRIQWVWNSDR